VARGTHAVVLAVPDEAALLDVAARLERRGLPFVLVREPDPPWHGAAMAIGLAPVPETPPGSPAPPSLPDRRAVRRVLGGLPLLT
jgi:hypothetical protein